MGKKELEMKNNFNKDQVLRSQGITLVISFLMFNLIVNKTDYLILSVLSLFILGYLGDWISKKFFRASLDRNQNYSRREK